MNDSVIHSGKLQQLIYSVRKSNSMLKEDFHDISSQGKEKTTECQHYDEEAHSKKSFIETLISIDLSPYDYSLPKHSEYQKKKISKLLVNFEPFGDKFKCRLCYKVMKGQQHSAHMERSHGIKPQCKICGKILHPGSLKRHYKSKHAMQEPICNVECLICH